MNIKLLTPSAEQIAAYRTLLPKVQGRLAKAALERLICEAEASASGEERSRQAERVDLQSV